MIGPPSLSFKVGGSRWQAVIGGLLLALGTISVLGMALSPRHFSTWAVACAILGWICTVWVFYRARRDAPVGTLYWDGTHWHWADSLDYSVQSVSVAMDFQRLILVRVERTFAPRMWLWLEWDAVQGSKSWISLRRALVYAAHQPRSSGVSAQEGAYP
jgi:hypothetical protein